MPELTKEQIALQTAVIDALGTQAEALLHQQGVVCIVLAQRGDSSIVLTPLTQRLTERALVGALQKLMGDPTQVPIHAKK